MLLDYSIADRKAQTRSFADSLCCEEGIKNVREVLGLNSRSCIPDLNNGLFVGLHKVDF